MIRFRALLALTAIVAALAMLVVQSDARPSGSSGSRGSRTYSAPPPTATAPNAARPMERTMTQPGQAAQPSAAARPQAQTTGAGGFFSRPGLLGGLAAGFLGAGLFGLLSGNGMFGNLGGLSSFLGLIFQVGLVALVVWFAWRMWQRRSQPQTAYASAGGPMMRQCNVEPMGRSALGRLGLGGGAPQPAANQAGQDEVGIGGEEFDTFERLLGEVQDAYSREDLGALRSRLTPEMLSYYSEYLSANASRGVHNQISNIKLEQGDLSEAWREGEMEYATVAMRYSLVDRTVDRASGKLVEGSDAPTEAIELWTFVRARGGNWLLSAIQQVN